MIAGRKLLSPRALLVEESRASVAVTVAWMLTILISGLALLAAATAFAVTQTVALPQATLRNIALLANLFLWIAFLTAPLCLVFTVVVHRVRQDRPPLAITILAVMLGVLPIALVLLMI